MMTIMLGNKVIACHFKPYILPMKVLPKMDEKFAYKNLYPVFLYKMHSSDILVQSIFQN